MAQRKIWRTNTKTGKGEFIFKEIPDFPEPTKSVLEWQTEYELAVTDRDKINIISEFIGLKNKVI